MVSGVISGLTGGSLSDIARATLKGTFEIDVNSGNNTGNSNPSRNFDAPEITTNKKGELTNYINVYRTKTGYVHGCPGNP